MQNIELKKGLPNSSLGASLSTFIEQQYHRRAEEFGADFKALDEMRSDAINVISVPECVPKLVKYCGQLSHLAAKFPFGDEIKVTFSWHNFAGKETKPISSHDIGFEQASLLMNAALLNAKLGALEGRGTPDKLRKACNYYLVASGILNHVIEKYSRRLSLPAGSDMTEPVLHALVQLLLAQAQECFVLKGAADKTIRDPMLAKLSMSASAMYTSAADLAAREKAIFNPSWIVHCQTKAQYFLAFANSKKATEMIASDAYGKEICRLEIALQYAREAKSLLDQYGKVKESGKIIPPEIIADVTAIMAHINKNLERAKKDNDIIYHDQVPTRDSIGDIGVAVVANPIPFKPVEEQIDVVGAPIFDSLPSYALQKNLFGFFKRRDEAVSEIHKLSEDQKLKIDEALAKMNLPAALEAREEPQGLPSSLIEKCNEVRAQGGAESLHSARATVQMLRDDCIERLKNIESVLKEEEDEDDRMRDEHGSKWDRQKSSNLTQSLYERIESFRKTLKVADDSDKLVIARLEENIDGISELCKTLEELSAGIPDASKISVNHAAKAELHACLAEAEVLKNRLDMIPSSARDISAQINTSFLGEELLSDEDKVDKADSELSKFDSFREQISEIDTSIAVLLERLLSAFTSFSDRSAHQAALVQRTEAIHALEASYASFSTLSSNFNEGIQFYSKCAESIQKLDDEARNYRESRRFEFDDLMASIEEIAQRVQQQQSSYGGYQQSGYSHQPYGDPYGSAAPSSSAYGSASSYNSPSVTSYNSTPTTSAYGAQPTTTAYGTQSYGAPPPPQYAGGPLPGAASYSSQQSAPTSTPPQYSGGPLPGAASYSSQQSAPAPPQQPYSAPSYGQGQTPTYGQYNARPGAWTPGQPVQYGAPPQQQPPYGQQQQQPPYQPYGQQPPQQPGYFPPGYRPPY